MLLGLVVEIYTGYWRWSFATFENSRDNDAYTLPLWITEDVQKIF